MLHTNWNSLKNTMYSPYIRYYRNGKNVLWQYNILTLGTEGAICQPPERRLVLMVTYGDLFTFVIMLCAVITLVRRKK